MQSIVISNLRATRMALTSCIAVVRAKSDSLSAKNDLVDAYINDTNSANRHSRILRRSMEKNDENEEPPLPATRKAPLNSTLILSDNKQLAEMPSHKIRAMIQYDTLTPECINLVLRFIAAKQVPSSMLGLVEEKALSYLALDDDDLITRYIRRTPEYDYDSLCELFMGLASNHRRPTPLLKAAATQLCKLPAEKRADFTLIAGALSALVSLNYPNKPLIARLMNDLAATLNYDRFGPKAMCNLLRIMRSLRWRSNKLLDDIIDHLSVTPSELDPSVIATLMHVLAHLDYPINDALQQLTKSFVESGKEEFIRRQPKSWLTYVWSLVALRLADKRHLESVLNDEFCRSLSDPGTEPPINYGDAMKLLNLRVLAEREYEFEEIDCYMIESLVQYKIQRSSENKRFHQRVETAIQGIVGSKEKMLTDVPTPFGFTIDFELALDRSSQLLPIDTSRTLDSRANPNGSRHLAAILVPFEDTISNLRGEPVGYKRMISRIFRSFGYQTVFLSEVILNREKTSEQLTNKIKELLGLPGGSTTS